jgi:tetratricopeptide (TPR) repeat protein
MSQTKPNQNQNQKSSSRQFGKAGKFSRSGQAGHSARPARRQVTGILLAATAAVIAATVYVVVWDPLKPPPAPAHMETGPSRGEQVRGKMAEIIAAADAIDPRGGAASLAERQVSYEQAAELGKRFVQFADQRDVLVRPVLAKALLRLGRLDDAEKTINALLKLAPRSAEGLCLKGELIDARGGQGALELFRRAAESDQATPDIWARYGSALMAAEQFDRAEAMLLKAFHAGCKDHQVHWGLAALAMRAGKFDQAEPRLAELAGSGRPSMRVLVMLAQCQKENAKPAEAEKTLRRALAQQEVPELYIPLGDVLQLQRKYPEAAEMFARAAEMLARAAETSAAETSAAETSAMEAAASFKAARVYYLLDRHGLAMKYIDRAAALVDDPDVRQWRRKIEDARFGQPDAEFGQPDAEFGQPDAGAAPPPVLPPPPPALPVSPLAGNPSVPSTADANAAPPSTKPAGGLLDFKCPPAKCCLPSPSPV